MVTARGPDPAPAEASFRAAVGAARQLDGVRTACVEGWGTPVDRDDPASYRDVLEEEFEEDTPHCGRSVACWRASAAFQVEVLASLRGRHRVTVPVAVRRWGCNRRPAAVGFMTEWSRAATCPTVPRRPGRPLSVRFPGSNDLFDRA